MVNSQFEHAVDKIAIEQPESSPKTTNYCAFAKFSDNRIFGLFPCNCDVVYCLRTITHSSFVMDLQALFEFEEAKNM